MHVIPFWLCLILILTPKSYTVNCDPIAKRLFNFMGNWLMVYVYTNNNGLVRPPSFPGLSPLKIVEKAVGTELGSAWLSVQSHQLWHSPRIFHLVLNVTTCSEILRQRANYVKTSKRIFFCHSQTNRPPNPSRKQNFTKSLLNPKYLK